jgi:hypothetical protein
VRVFHQVGMDGLAMGARVGNLALDGAQVQPERHDNGRVGTAVGHQGEDQGNQIGRIVLAAEGRAGAGIKGAATDGAALSLHALAMDGDVAAPDVPLQDRRNSGKIGLTDPRETSGVASSRRFYGDPRSLSCFVKVRPRLNADLPGFVARK